VYYPYLRGKMQELLAVRAVAPQIAPAGKIVPVIEPVSANLNSTAHAVSEFVGAQGRVIVIVNPKVGGHTGNPDVLCSAPLLPLLDSEQVVPGLIITSQTTPQGVDTFLRRHERPVCFIHLSTPLAQLGTRLNSRGTATTHLVKPSLATSYLNSLTGKLVTLNDSFARLERNADYPSREFFSDQHLTFQATQFSGFSDYSIVGDYFSGKGGPAHAVAIHLHQAERGKGLWIHHFVSDRVVGAADIAGKFAEALMKLVRFARANRSVAATNACQEYLRLNDRAHFPGLGMAKQSV